MSTYFARALCATAAIAGLIVARTAIAQSDQPAASSGAGLEEIVVTARKRQERVQTVPVAITAFSQTDLEKAHISELRDLYKEVPGISISQTGSDPNGHSSGQLRLRGLPGTEIYFADVPIGTTDFLVSGLNHGLSPGFMYDLDDLEVDKGAQGTLFGRPSIGGLISLQPKRPTTVFEGYLQTTFGNYGDKENEFAVNVPVVGDKLMVRVAGQMQQRDGYTKDLQTGIDLDNRNYYAWRVGVTFRPTDDFENYLLYDGYWQDSDGTSSILQAVNPDFILSKLNTSFTPLQPGQTCLATVTLSGPAFGPLGNVPGGCGAFRVGLVPGVAQALATQQALGPREIAGTYTSGIGKDYFYGFTDIARWDVTDDISIKNIAAVRVFKQLASNDFTNTGLPILVIGYPAQHGVTGNNQGWIDNAGQYTDELQITGKALNGKLTWGVGGFLEEDHPIGSNLTLGTAVGGVTYLEHNYSDRSQAVFAHGIYDLSDYVPNLRFTAGYRFTYDYVSFVERSLSGVNAVQRGANGAPTNCGVIGSDRNCEVGNNGDFNSPGWNLGLDDQITPDTLLYVRAGNAYRPGGVNPDIPAPYQTFKPEHLTDVELGVKTDWDLMGIHGRTNADIFHDDYKSIQVSQTVTVLDPDTGKATVASATLNAATATIEGAEFETTLLLPAGFELAAHGSYLYSHYGQYPQAFGATGGAPGFQYVPLFQFGLTPTYHLPIDQSLGDVTASISWSWYGHQSVSPILSEPINTMAHYENFDIRADWTNMFGQPIDLGFFMTNVTNNLHISGVVPLMTSLGFTSAAYNPPRMFGFSLKYRFEPQTSEAAIPAAPYTPPPAVAPAPAPSSYLVFFDFNKSDLTPEAVTIVDRAAKNAGPAKATQLTVTGHTDTVGSDAYNMRLSRRRAESVAAQLEKDGIPANEIEIVAKGKHDLLVPTRDGVREPQNRRVQIVYSAGPGA
jgi:iron complex outermembrane receptor protein